MVVAAAALTPTIADQDSLGRFLGRDRTAYSASVASCETAYFSAFLIFVATCGFDGCVIGFAHLALAMTLSFARTMLRSRTVTFVIRSFFISYQSSVVTSVLPRAELA
jgi:hypothetical protein